MIRLASACLAVCLVAAAVPAAAQGPQAWPARAFVTIDATYQPLDNGFSESLSTTDALMKTEKDVFNATYGSTRGPAFDVGTGVRLAGAFGVGVTGAWFQRKGDVAWDLSVPNPLVANRPRALNGTATGMNRREAAVHVQALYGVPLGAKARIMFSAGPSLFSVRQDLVQSIDFTEVTGFASIRLNQIVASTVTRTAVGYNVGADITWSLGAHVGVGTVTRYSRASVTMDPGAASAGVPRAIASNAGGLQVGAGIRLFF